MTAGPGPEAKPSVLRPLETSTRRLELTCPFLRSPSPPYFFVKVDVRSCFDTIDQTKLMEILEEILEAVSSLFESTLLSRSRLPTDVPFSILPQDDDFSVIRFNKAKLSGGQVRKKFLQKAFPSGSSLHPSRLVVVSSSVVIHPLTSPSSLPLRFPSFPYSLPSTVDAPTFPELADTVARKHHREILMDKVRPVSEEPPSRLVRLTLLSFLSFAWVFEVRLSRPRTTRKTLFGF